MSKYLIPTKPDFVEEIAKAIARNRLISDAADTVEKLVGITLEDSESLEKALNHIFEDLWTGQTETDERQRELYRADALAAISAINLKIITSM